VLTTRVGGKSVTLTKGREMGLAFVRNGERSIIDGDIHVTLRIRGI
jgi:hypothetical protein